MPRPFTVMLADEILAELTGLQRQNEQYGVKITLTEAINGSLAEHFKIKLRTKFRKRRRPYNETRDGIGSEIKFKQEMCVQRPKTPEENLAEAIATTERLFPGGQAGFLAACDEYRADENAYLAKHGMDPISKMMELTENEGKTNVKNN